MIEQQTYEELAQEQGLTPQMVNEWWGHTEFWQMENISNLRQDDFDPEDGYQEFVDACDEWWDNLTWEDKVIIYYLNN